MNESTDQRLETIRNRITQAARRSGREETAVELIAVSKGHPPERLAELIDADQLVFGESRVQEARSKAPRLPGRARWHLVGHLQSNKIRQALPLFERIHSVDSLELANDLNRIAGELGLFPKVLLQVNLAAESSKYGFAPDRLEADLETLLALDRLEIDGLMAIPPLTPDAEGARPFFVKLRMLRDRLAIAAGVPFGELSMGMSHDFEVAIEEGSTMVRVGTALFGPRERKAWKPEAGE
ncbi:MAG TPA: YggS family pyridoxal phosphate-dependent enzyme [Chthoniobacteraceae bacterium]|nr:YggS family pyridoxal phosphate-dependent enzyme [Chthoniobacteraceae bacterium]